MISNPTVEEVVSNKLPVNRGSAIFNIEEVYKEGESSETVNLNSSEATDLLMVNFIQIKKTI